MRRSWPPAFLLVGLLVLAGGGCATVASSEDLRIEAEVKAQLVAEKDANLTRVGVRSRDAVVYLTGTVESADQRGRAETVARDVRGVRRVEDRLVVR